MKQDETKLELEGSGPPILLVDRRQRGRILIHFQNTQSGGWRCTRPGLESFDIRIAIPNGIQNTQVRVGFLQVGNSTISEPMFKFSLIYGLTWKLSQVFSAIGFMVTSVTSVSIVC